MENYLQRRKNGGGSSRHFRNSYAPTPEVTVKILQGRIENTPR